MSSIKKPMLITSWVLQFAVAAIFVMAAVPKFTGAEETKALFEVLGVEPIGRYAVGGAELVAAVLLLWPGKGAIGAILSLFVISGAILTHLLKLGISIDPVALGKPALEPVAGASMFALAVVVFVASVGIITIRVGQLPFVARREESAI